MKYAIIEISGKQFWVEKGKFYDFNKIPIKKGKDILLNKVLLINDNGKILLGKPYLKNVKIAGKILQHFREKKKLVYKMKSKKKTKRKQGHRQDLTRILINDIKLEYKQEN